jgi:LacI family transcriptional regulator
MISLKSSKNLDLEHFKELKIKGLPIVFFDRVPQDYAAHKVTTDNFAGAYQATKHLIEQGYRKIAHLTTTSWLSITWLLFIILHVLMLFFRQATASRRLRCH